MVLGIKVIGLLLFLGIAPFLCGTLFTKYMKKDAEEILLNWTAGFIGMMALTQLLVVPATFGHVDFRIVCILFYAAVILCALLGLVFERKRIGGMITAWGMRIRKTPLIVWAAVVLVLMQVFVYVCYTHEDADDAFYVATAVTAVENNSLFEIDPYTGTAYYGLPTRYVLSPFPVFYAILSRCTMLHPALVAHTVLPAVLLCFTYAVYALAGLKLFDGSRGKTGWMVFLTGLFLIYSGYTTSTPGSMMLLRIWQGKGFLAAALLPMIVYLLLRFLKEEEAKGDYVLLFVLMLACCLASSMGIVLGAVLLGCGGLLLAVFRRSFRFLIRMVVCALPNIAFALAYIVIR